ncbi:transposase [Sphaerisporangium sp. NBC_01403]|uniref:transposase n=1 Tax=Sphaerisporangium sp. NBC_01403 TaxID=2903599 RepID=UPI003253B980
MQRLAHRIRDLTNEVVPPMRSRPELLAGHAGHLLQMRGVGVITAAQCRVSWSGPGRFRSEAAFAALTGVSPIEAGSGKNTRHRLNPFGDRALKRHATAVLISRRHASTSGNSYPTSVNATRSRARKAGGLGRAACRHWVMQDRHGVPSS